MTAKSIGNIDNGTLPIEQHVEVVNSFGQEGLWELGQYICNVLVPEGQKHKKNRDQLLEEISSHPKARHPYALLRQCLVFFSVYPDIHTRPLPENYYFDLAVRVFDAELRQQYEQQAVDNSWNVTRLRKAIRDGVLERRERRRNELGFDLKVTNWWYFNSADPRFGKSSFKGRIAGQIIANGLYFYTKSGDVVLDPFAGGGTLGDVIDKLDYFASLTYKMYDLKPQDDRIKQNDIILGLPEPDSSIDYIFLDPPYGSIPKGYYTSSPQDLSQMTSEAYINSMKGLIRECWRVLREKRSVSIVVEPFISGNSFFDLPSAIRQEFLDMGFAQTGKVYLPNQAMRRGDMMPHIIETAKQQRFLLSDCRELLTFTKHPSLINRKKQTRG